MQNSQRLIRLGMKTELEQKIRTLTARILTGTSVIAQALYTTGDLRDINMVTAETEFEQLKTNMEAIKTAQEELERLEAS